MTALPRKYMALAGRLRVTLTLTRPISRSVDLGDGRTDDVDISEREEEVEVTGTYEPAEKPEYDGGNCVYPGCSESIELDNPGDLTKAERDRAIEALLEEHAEQAGRLESQAEDRADGERVARRLRNG